MHYHHHDQSPKTAFIVAVERPTDQSGCAMVTLRVFDDVEKTDDFLIFSIKLFPTLEEANASGLKCRAVWPPYVPPITIPEVVAPAASGA